MKKAKFLIPLLTIVFLAGCTSSSKRRSNGGVTSQEPVTSVPPSTKTTGDTGSSSITSDTSVIPPQPGEEVTKTIETFGDNFVNVGGFNGGGQQIDSAVDGQKDNVTKLKTYFDTICDQDGMLSSLTCSKMNTGKPANDYYTVWLCIGTQAGTGSLVWKSTAQMKSVVLNVRTYFRYYTYGSESAPYHPENSIVSINGQETALTANDGTTEPTPITINYSPSENFTTLTISNLISGTSYSRFFIDSITITWVY